MEKGLCRCWVSGGFPGTCPVSSHFTNTSYGTDTLPTIALVLNPRVDRFVHILRLFQAKFPENLAASFASLTPIIFLESKVKGIYFPSAGTQGCVVWFEAEIAHSQGNPSYFYSPHMNVGLSMPILPPLPLCTMAPCLSAPSLYLRPSYPSG